jgi:hypothetical protein
MNSEGRLPSGYGARERRIGNVKKGRFLKTFEKRKTDFPTLIGFTRLPAFEIDLSPPAFSSGRICLSERTAGGFEVTERGRVSGIMEAVREKGVPFEAVYRLVTPEGRKTLSNMVALAHQDWLGEQSVGENKPVVSVEASDTITIPADATAEGLVAKAKKAFEKAGIPFTFFSGDALEIIRRDLELVKGKTLRVLTHRFQRDWKTAEART